MAAYVIGNVVEVKDEAGFEEYLARVPDVVRRHGGRYVVRGEAIEALEGSWRPRRLGMIEFESVEAVRRWYDADDYRELRELRQRTAVVDVLLVEGV